ncbi:Mediator of RNA polymerase II transcription subunit 14 [Sarcoptes scabiei]|uniref:Mediator of RNA polymerase II transcription subunit 14 n=1 Tax=Sarcoptes scabiei TaxID=52283 RepID=A0A834R743_SARSC|nr:Mediator of RNA polymerase II transcription subunit 14 [Sarcoptes scabiei]
MAITMSNVNNNSMPMAPNNGQMPTQMVSIGDMLELSIKKAYRDLTLLADLLPRKTDMERKIEIMLFANRNRQLFVRLLSLVKWAGSASKVEKCSQIVSFLDKNSMLFTETADILARLSRETLVTARLPAFQLLSAVEVMTLGTYSRLPSCIRDRLVPPEPIPNEKKRAALLQLNHIIQQRLVSSELPLQMRSIRIEYGKITFTVMNEFTLTLTLLSDNADLPWKVLNIEILVEDKEINDIKDLVYPFQLIYIRNIVQARLNENNNPLVEAYNILHSFCLGLQLQVLHYQSVYLQIGRLKDFIHIEEYVSSKHLILSYWKDQDKNAPSFKLAVKIDASEPSQPLQIEHSPELESTVFSKSIQANILSIEKILLSTTHQRSKIKLFNLKKLIEEENSALICELKELPAVLHVSFISPCMPSEQLLISVDMLNGQFLVHIPQYEDCPLINDFEIFLNKSIDKKFTAIDNLRIWIIRERCKKTVEALPVRTMESLPFPPNYSHDLLNIEGHKIYFQFTRHQNKCLILVYDNEKDDCSKIWMEYYLVELNHISIVQNESTENDDSQQLDTTTTTLVSQENPKNFTEIIKVLPLDTANILLNYSIANSDANVSKRKRKKPESQSSSTQELIVFDKKQQRKKLPGYYITDLAHIVSFCEEKLSYHCLSIELSKRNIEHRVMPDFIGCSHYIDIVKFPPCHWCPIRLTEKILSNTVSCTIRLQGKSSKLWNVLMVFDEPPLRNLPMVDELLYDWTSIARLYDIVENFSYEAKQSNILSTIEIKSFTYKKLFIGYGTDRSFFVSIHYKFLEKRFQLSFGVANQNYSNTNPHIIISNQLQQEFNNHLSIVQLIQVLNCTLNPLLTIQNLKSIPLLGTVNSRPHLPVLSYTVLPESSNHIKLIYRNIYCLDIIMYADNLVSIRDGALSNFDNSKVISEFMPIQGLKAFLIKFIDKTVQSRRLSQTEDDNPPSPISQTEFTDNFMFTGSHYKTFPLLNENISKCNASLQHSSPLTPQSPMPSVLSAHSNYAPSPNTFSQLPLSPSPHPQQQHQMQISAQSNPMAPSPQTHPIEQSPANVFNINSPMNANLTTSSPSFLPVPSPGPNTNFHTHSPAPQILSQNTPSSHEMAIGSPFNQPNIPTPINSSQSIASPVPNLWPASPSVSRPSPRPSTSIQSPIGSHLMANPIPMQQQAAQQQQYSHTFQSRSLPQKPWAAALPTILTHQGFEMMCRTNDGTPMTNLFYSYSQLDRFLGSTFMRRHFSKPIEENFTIIPTAEPGTILFKNDSLQFKIWMDYNTLLIHLYVMSISEMNQWSREELDVFQQYFETKVACAPFKPNSFIAFSRILVVPVLILKDLIRLMNLELHSDQTLKWNLQIVLTYPPFCAQINPNSVGMSAFLILKNKILLFIQLTYKGSLPGSITAQMMNQPIIFMLPLVYDTNSNSMNLSYSFIDRYSNQNMIQFVNKILKKYNDFTAKNTTECVLYRAVREIMATLQYIC